MEMVINFSGGKDSTAMLAYLCEHYPDVKKHVVFADTGWEHPGTEQWCRDLVARFGLELHVVRSSTKTFLTMAQKRGMFPGMNERQCTSDLKRDPIVKWIRNNVKDPLVINCSGIRSEESSKRKKIKKLKRNLRETNSKRTIWDWCPIKDWTEEDVLAFLAVRQLPLHPVYKYLRRFSCRVCIFMTLADLQAVQLHDPEAIQTIHTIEQEIGFSFKPEGYLKDLLKLTT
jgi:3'-phosphoadenosine 5'-phosphosulfate sulfotransferase (PAPS reductase)/FAD synthetase